MNKRDITVVCICLIVAGIVFKMIPGAFILGFIEIILGGLYVASKEF